LFLTSWATGFSNVTSAAHPHQQMEMLQIKQAIMLEFCS
jgi:hypothetical protein